VFNPILNVHPYSSSMNAIQWHEMYLKTPGLYHSDQEWEETNFQVYISLKCR